MVEAGAQQVSEADVLGAIEFGHECCKKIAAGIRELVKVAGKKKREFTPPVLDQAIYDQISKEFRAELADALRHRKTAKSSKATPGWTSLRRGFWNRSRKRTGKWRASATTP